MDKTTQLEKRVAELEKTIKQLTASNSIPENIEKALMGRGFVKTEPKGVPPEGWNDPSQEGFIVQTTPNAQAPATRYLRVLNFEGTNYWIALYTFAEFL